MRTPYWAWSLLCTTCFQRVGLFGIAALIWWQISSKAKYWRETDSEQVPWGKGEKNFEKRVKKCLKLLKGKRWKPTLRALIFCFCVCHIIRSWVYPNCSLYACMQRCPVGVCESKSIRLAADGSRKGTRNARTCISGKYFLGSYCRLDWGFLLVYALVAAL